MCDSVAYCISRTALNQLFASSIGLANLGLRLMDHQFLQQENWLISSGSPRAKERYLNLIKETPELDVYKRQMPPNTMWVSLSLTPGITIG